MPSCELSESCDAVKVFFYATLRPIVGARSLDISLPGSSSIHELVDHLAARWPELVEHLFDEQGELSRRVNIMLDGRNIRWLEGLATRVDRGQKVEIFPPVAGV